MSECDRESRSEVARERGVLQTSSEWLLGLVVSAAPLAMCGQGVEADDSGEESLRGAGNEARFRVIERVPDSGSEETSSLSLKMRVSEELGRSIRRERWEEASRLVRKRLGELDAPLRFLRAYVQYRRGDYGTAYERLVELRGTLPKLADYVSYVAALCARELDRHHDAVLRAAEIPEESRLWTSALHLLADSLMESGADSDWERAKKVVDAYLSQPDGKAHAAELRLKTAEQFIERDAWDEAGDRLFALLEHDPLSAEADRARKLLERHRDEFHASHRKKIDDRPPEYRTAYYRALFERHRSDRLVEELPEEIDTWTVGSRERCRALYWVGRSETKLRHHETSVEWYEKILENCRDVGPYERRALYLGGKGYWNIGRRSRALELFEELYTEFSEHSYADDAMYFSARIYREQGREERASEMLRTQVDRYPTGDMAADAHWLQVRRWLEADAPEKVVAYVDDLDQMAENSGETRGRLKYFEGRAHRELGDEEASQKAYRSVASNHPLDYYALLALNRLADLEGASDGPIRCGASELGLCRALPTGAGQAKGFDASELSESIRRSSQYEKAKILLSIGLREWAGDEFQRLLARGDGARLAIGDLLHRAGVFSVSYRIPDAIEGWRDRYPGSGNRRPWEIAYPKAFEEEVEGWSEKRGLPPALTYAVIRKESGFDPGVESWANARGLMQLMWGTAQNVADDAGISDLTKTSLFDPERNVELGTAYLSNLADRFDGHPVLLAAGYNGGHGNVSGWLANREGLEVDLWVEDIPYGQTRRYAKLAVAYYWAYRWLYDEQSVPRIDFDLSGVRAKDGG